MSLLEYTDNNAYVPLQTWKRHSADDVTMERGTNNKAPWWAPNPGRQRAKIVGRTKTVLSTLLLVAVLMVPFTVVGLVNPALIPTTLSNGATRETPTLLAQAAGCNGITQWPEAPAAEIGTVDQPEKDFAWRITPPVSGNFSPHLWTGDTVLYPGSTLTPSEGLHLAYRGWVVVWYAANAPRPLIDRLGTWQSASDLAKIMVAPWTGASDKWPAGKNIAFTAWNTTQSCIDFDPDVATAFVEKDRIHNTAPGLALTNDQAAPQAKAISHRITD